MWMHATSLILEYKGLVNTSLHLYNDYTGQLPMLSFQLLCIAFTYLNVLKNNIYLNTNTISFQYSIHNYSVAEKGKKMYQLSI